MAGAQPRTSLRSLFKQVEILHIPYFYILSFMNFFAYNQEIFQTNCSICNINTRNKHHLYWINVNLPYFQNLTFYDDIRIFISLPRNVTIRKENEV